MHVPFCQQICAYCNLYAVAGDSDSEHIAYIDTVLREVMNYSGDIHARPIDTVYIGGGTPSLLSPALLGKLLRTMSQIVDFELSDVPEVALEVSPESVTRSSTDGFIDAGINRINLGIQTFDERELSGIGRKHSVSLQTEALTMAMDAGFANVCVDLIYGLPSQTSESWRQNLEQVIPLRPETICCYPLTLRPSTGYAASGYNEIEDAGQFEKYDMANELLASAGYTQETHVRWVLPGLGGYRQKTNHWSGQDIVGFGAGARSYLRDVDLRNGYSVRHRRRALREYYKSVELRGHGLTDGILMSEDERSRKAIILGLGQLNKHAFHSRFGYYPAEKYSLEIQTILDAGLAVEDDESIALTTLGHRHRDVIVQMFFSEDVRQRVSEHTYDD